jgi:TldD protein
MSVRVIADGAWGFAASAELGRGAVEATAAEAVAIARASARVKREDVRLAPEKPAVADWATPYKIDPFTVSVEQNIELLLKIDAELRAVAGITLAETNMNFRRYEQWFFSTEGAEIHQTITTSGAGYAAHSFARERKFRSALIPIPLAGNIKIGYELIEELRLLENATEIGEQAVALHSAEQCPEGAFDIILDSRSSRLQIHESVGHPIELDRVLGMEANFAGTSFLTLDKLRTLKYGSEIVNVVADATEAHGPGLGTFAYDDEGVAAQRTPIITNGLFTGYLTSRDTAAAIGATRSGRCAPKAGTGLPIVRMTNVSMLPSESPLTLEQLIARPSAAS